MKQGRAAKKTAFLRYLYTFSFPNGTKRKFEVKLDPETLEIVGKSKSKPPEWASMEFVPCDGCFPNPNEHKYCPIAVNIADLIKTFREISSTEQALVTVETPERTTSKVCAVQSGLYSLLGIYMVASGCPVMEKLKPMVRFHLPFASIQETVYRVFSMYLTAQYYRSKKGLKPDWTLRGLSELYREINEVNIRLSRRITKASEQDAAINALVSLDVFTHFLQRPLPELMESLEPIFQPYLDSNAKTAP